MRARFASIDLIAWCTAAEPVAQAFSTRVAGLKRKASLAWSTRGAVKSWGEKPALKWPSTISSTSSAPMPACSRASRATRTTRLSMLSASSLPKGVCAQPTMQGVMTVSSRAILGRTVGAQRCCRKAQRCRAGLKRRRYSGLRRQEQADADDGKNKPRDLAPRGGLREQPPRHGLSHQHLDKGEGADIGGGGERKSDEPELRGERAEEPGEERGPPRPKAPEERRPVEGEKPGGEDRRLKPEPPGEGRRRPEEKGAAVEGVDGAAKAGRGEREEGAGCNPEQDRPDPARPVGPSRQEDHAGGGEQDRENGAAREPIPEHQEPEHGDL